MISKRPVAPEGEFVEAGTFTVDNEHVHRDTVRHKVLMLSSRKADPDNDIYGISFRLRTLQDLPAWGKGVFELQVDAKMELTHCGIQGEGKLRTAILIGKSGLSPSMLGEASRIAVLFNGFETTMFNGYPQLVGQSIYFVVENFETAHTQDVYLQVRGVTYNA